MPVDDGVSNLSSNRSFQSVLDVAVSRRQVMAGSLAVATGFFLPPGLGFGPKPGGGSGGGAGGQQPLLGFTPAANDGGPNPTISPDYEYSVLIPWGTSLFAGTPDLDPLDVGANTSANQERQVGIGHDGMWFFADWRSNRRGALCINHEFGTNAHVLRKGSPESLEDVRISQAAHGVSVIELIERRGVWKPVVPGRRNRRITVNSPVTFSGPAASSALLQTPAGNAPLGTVNNCANGYTPWGTYLTCEENFNGYFGSNGAWTATPEQARYGFSPTGFAYGWHIFDERFDLSNPNFVNEENRFGWVVEIDPDRPDEMPVKRTAMGRFKHESVALVEGRGKRVVAYMGDDERFDYIYKFVSAKNWKSMRARGQSPLDEGTLYVARFDDDFTGEWLPLTTANPALAGWTMDRILVHTRLAADAVGATKMDRPEWCTVNPNGEVFCTLTNNSRREVADAANPLAPNPDGHIIRWKDADDHVGTTFEWDIFVLSQDTFGNPDYEFASPDGLWADEDGRLFIQTDGGQPNGRNNQMIVADVENKEFRRLFAGVTDDEITGIAVTPDGRTMFINTQHPGNGDPAGSNFPVPGAGGPEVPRDATFVITRKDGGVIGS